MATCKPISHSTEKATAQQIESIARKMDRPYQPSRTPWLIGLILTLAMHGAVVLKMVVQAPALDASKPPPLPALAPHSKLIYMDGSEGVPNHIDWPQAKATDQNPER